jgi:cytochrome P450
MDQIVSSSTQQLDYKVGHVIHATRNSPDKTLVHIDIYGHGKNFKKAQRYAAMVHRAPNTLTVIDKKKHGKKRRVISQGFSDAALKGHELVILEQIKHLCTQLKTGAGGQAVPVGAWTTPKNMGRMSMSLVNLPSVRHRATNLQRLQPTTLPLM